jgi:hypothetical protein
MRAVVKQFGPFKSLQVVGFCLLWRKMGRPKVDGLSAGMRQYMAENGVGKSAAYTYLGELRAWNTSLARSPEQVEELLEAVAGVFDLDEEEAGTPEAKAVLSTSRKTVIQ